MTWAEVVANGFAVPAGVNPPEVLGDLLSMLGNEDPEVRDAQAYSVLTHWTQAGHFDAVLRRLGDEAAGGLHHASILVRSFSALILGEAVGRAADTGLVPDAIAAWRGAWAAWYAHEPDVRSHDPRVGWIHAVAHGADTAGDLARHPASNAADLAGIAATLTARLRSLPLPLHQTEDDRLALALLMLLTRPEFGPEAIAAWSRDYRTLWTELVPGPIPPGAALGVRTLHSLHTLLHLGATLGGAVLRPAHPVQALDAVQDALRSVYPYYGQPD